MILASLGLGVGGEIIHQRVSGQSILLPDRCLEGAVLDDGSVESGYGWVPSVVEGQYVQAFHPEQLGGRRLQSVCVCWFRTVHSQSDQTLEFDVVGFSDVGGEPSEQPLFAVSSSVTIEKLFEDGGAVLTEVPMPANLIPEEVSYLGVRWNAAIDRFFFVCSDQSEKTPPAVGFFTDDRAEGWVDVHETTDPIFANHRAFVIRPRGMPAVSVDIPTLGRVSLALLSGTLAGCGAVLARRRKLR